MRRGSFMAFIAVGVALVASTPAAGLPGGLAVTGHDPDYHSTRGANQLGARNLIRTLVGYTTFGRSSPTMLLVTDLENPGGDQSDSRLGLTNAGYTFDVADHGSGAPGVLDLHAVDFNAYDVVVVASDYGGWLRQRELDILNARATDLHAYVNGGGALVAFAESGGRGGAPPIYNGTTSGRFGFLPFLISGVSLNQFENGFTLTSFGSSLGLLPSDVNGNASHNFFADDGGLDVVNRDAGGRIMTLVARGGQLCPGGVPSASVDDAAVLEPDSGDVTTMAFTVSLSTAPCAGPASIDVITSDGTAQAGSDYVAVPLTTLTFDPGQTTKTVTVAVKGDDVHEPDETLHLGLVSPAGMTVSDDQGLGTILNDDPPNRPPDCSSASAAPRKLWPPNHKLQAVVLTATDDDGDTVAIDITGVTQDEPLDGIGDGDTSPDAAAGSAAGAVRLRAERAGGGDGRVYRIAFDATDEHGARCSGTAVVGVPHDRDGAPALDSGGTYRSFG